MTDTLLTLEQMSAAAETKRPSPPDKQTNAEALIAADAERRERARLDRRKQIRQQIAEREILMQTVTDLESQLQLLDRRADAAAEKHAEATAPLQAKLATASGEARTKLLESLTTANVTLETSLDVINRLRTDLSRQHRLVRTEAAQLPVENQLAGRDVANPKTLCELFACEKRSTAAQGRIETAREWVTYLTTELKRASTTPVPSSSFGWGKEGGKLQIDFETTAILSQRLARWKCEYVHASAEQAAATDWLNELTRDLISE